MTEHEDIYRDDIDEAPTKPEPVTIRLRHPIEHGKRTITEITLQPYSGKIARRVTKHPENNPIAFFAELVFLLAGQPMEVVDKLTGKDLEEATLAAARFFANSPATGKTPSPE